MILVSCEETIKSRLELYEDSMKLDKPLGESLAI